MLPIDIRATEAIQYSYLEVYRIVSPSLNIRLPGVAISFGACLYICSEAAPGPCGQSDSRKR